MLFLHVLHAGLVQKCFFVRRGWRWVLLGFQGGLLLEVAGYSKADG